MKRSKNERENETLLVEIALARCEQSHLLFGVRVEERSSRVWAVTWSFLIQESSAHRERYADTEIQGSITLASEYPGCPGCGAGSVVVCGCPEGRVTCWGGQPENICAWCGARGRPSGTMDRLRTRGDV